MEENRTSSLDRLSNSFTRFYFEIINDKTKGIILFKNVLKHEMGHALGLAHIIPEDINLDDFAEQVPLMWPRIDQGIDVNNPKSYFDSPLRVDPLTLETLSCIYDLDALRQAHPI